MAITNRNSVDKNPNFSEKEALQLSRTTVLRRREPTNQQTTSKFPAMVWDYSNQQKVWPNGSPSTLVEASTRTGHRYDTINQSGHPYALGVFVGGSPDTSGRMYAKSKKTKILK